MLINSIFPYFAIDGILGKGAEGKVSRTRHYNGSEWVYYAFKELSKDSRLRSQKPDVLNANRMKGEWLTFLNGMGCQGRFALAYHRNMNEVCVINASVARYFYKNRSALGNNEFEMSALFMDYYPNSCDLITVIENHNIHADYCRNIAFRVCYAVAFLDAKGIIHRDLKPENILHLSNGKIKIIDFGFAARCKKGETKKKALGTTLYLPPRRARTKYVKRDHPTYTTKRDCYAVAVIIYMLATGLMPFLNGENDKATVTRMFIERAGVASAKSIYNNIKDPELLDLIQNLGAFEEEDRFTMNQALAHPYFDEVRESCSDTFF